MNSFIVHEGERYYFFLNDVKKHNLDFKIISQIQLTFSKYQLLIFRYDFVLDAKEKSGVYQMRFGGLYDCSNLKAHGLGLLIYDNIMTDLVITISLLKFW